MEPYDIYAIRIIYGKGSPQLEAAMERYRIMKAKEMFPPQDLKYISPEVQDMIRNFLDENDMSTYSEAIKFLIEEREK